MLFTLFSKLTIAIVNMDGIHFDNNEDTFTVDIDFAVSGSSGNSDKSKAALNTQLSWIANKTINLAILGSQYGESNGIRNVNKSFIHYRYIQQLTEMVDLEIFSQLESNEFTRLSYRGLIGAGARFSVVKSTQHHAFIGVGAFQSQEEVEFTAGLTDDGTEEFARANLYILSKYNVNSNISFSNVLYYQPRIDELNDYRALLETKLDFKINKDINFRISVDIEHDSNPSQTIENTDISYLTGLRYSF